MKDKIKEIKEQVKSTLLLLMAHPDNQPESEFADRIDGLIDVKDQLEGITELHNKEEKRLLIDFCEYIFTETTYTTETNYTPQEQVEIYLENK